MVSMVFLVLLMLVVRGDGGVIGVFVLVPLWNTLPFRHAKVS